MAEAQLMFSGEISLAWNTPLACRTSVGLGLSGGGAEELAFSDLPALVMPQPPDCTTFSGASFFMQLLETETCYMLYVTGHSLTSILDL